MPSFLESVFGCLVCFFVAVFTIPPFAFVFLPPFPCSLVASCFFLFPFPPLSDLFLLFLFHPLSGFDGTEAVNFDSTFLPDLAVARFEGDRSRRVGWIVFSNTQALRNVFFVCVDFVNMGVFFKPKIALVARTQPCHAVLRVYIY